MSEKALHKFDVVVIGAGISGVSAGYHLQKHCPDKSYVILEGRHDMGGTWDLFRYPGIRSDSDMFTLGFGFRPWPQAKVIADGPSIKAYVKETARAFAIDDHIRFGRRVTRLEWRSDIARWRLTSHCDGEEEVYETPFVMSCAGYYRYEAGYTPDFPGAETFAGDFIHPQNWPRDLDTEGKKIVVIGSGATAVTLVPALAQKAAHVVMLQRSPSYYFSMPAESGLSRFLNRLAPRAVAHTMMRWQRVLLQQASFKFARARPDFMAKKLIRMTRDRLPENYDVEKHFTPRYNPWEQRLCVVPDDDLFDAIKAGQASVVTDTIERIDENGVALASGDFLDADIIVTATGLELQIFGGADIVIDGAPVCLGDLMTYKGAMFEGAPNLVSVFGYTNASWTLRADLVSAYACRLINYMADNGFEKVTPVNATPDIAREPFLDFSSGYVARAAARLPKQGANAPWRHPQDYFRDIGSLRYASLKDGVLQFSPAASRETDRELSTPVA